MMASYDTTANAPMVDVPISIIPFRIGSAICWKNNSLVKIISSLTGEYVYGLIHTLSKLLAHRLFLFCSC